MQKLIQWITATYQTTPLNIVYETPIEYRGRSPRLTVIFEHPEDQKVLLNKNGFTENQSQKKSILKKFISLVNELNLQNKYDTKSLFVVYDNFSDSFKSIYLSKTIHKEKGEHIIRDKFPETNLFQFITYNYCLILFLETENDVQKLKKNGVANEIKKTVYNLIRKHDSFNYISYEDFPIYFDSKQNLDEKYGGSMRAYFD
ncbi:hypothetical protein [uncultured Aquimarina sp.]|uniref:hypothetical protein n=1 Tax=uncultured Aquimarina sp. TaxID=575652 RepID=UPI00260318AB|nr:hypothetical protein [uncultured Aquimarina sp.]